MRRIWATVLAIVGASVTSAHADSVTLAGTSIPIRDCTISSIERGRVMYAARSANERTSARHYQEKNGRDTEE